MPRVSIDDQNMSFDINNEDIIYDALSDRGHDLPHGCLSGSCGACRIEIISGAENLVPVGFIEANTIESLRDEFIKTRGVEFVEGKTIRLACRAKVRGDVVIKPIP